MVEKVKKVEKVKSGKTFLVKSGEIYVLDTKHVQGFNEMRQILTNLKEEDLCLTRHG